MPQPIVYIDASTVRMGKLAELEVAMSHLAVFADANVPENPAAMRDSPMARPGLEPGTPRFSVVTSEAP